MKRRPVSAPVTAPATPDQLRVIAVDRLAYAVKDAESDVTRIRGMLARSAAWVGRDMESLAKKMNDEDSSRPSFNSLGELNSSLIGDVNRLCVLLDAAYRKLDELNQYAELFERIGPDFVSSYKTGKAA